MQLNLTAGVILKIFSDQNGMGADPSEEIPSIVLEQQRKGLGTQEDLEQQILTDQYGRT